MARLLDPHVDLLLVGDSLGMVLYGFETTLPVTLEMMVQHGAAVRRASSQAAVVIDMPFGAYQESPAQAFANAARVLRDTGAQAVKLEGGIEMAETVAFLVERGIPVMGHVGLTPQSVHQMGGYRARGREKLESDHILRGAQEIAQAGAFAIVVEGVMEALAQSITTRIPVPTIGIGASAACDGQVLVTEDVLGLSGMNRPRFAKGYADLGPMVEEAVRQYGRDVRSRRFPSAEHVFGAAKKPVMPHS
jgi:3-methyl-2-oxobutanoate hydroxymethyltransferase